ncbi:MAG: hypothetical protein KR126chlam2_00221 [Chlamydiae bacterium]|nr:hypothetical protein [Chlamydiota bacterium]
MKLLKNTLILLSIIVATCYGTITKVDTMQEVMCHFENADSDTLAIFDIDKVLLQPSDPAFQTLNIKYHRESVNKVIRSLPEDKIPIFVVLASIHSDSILVDEKTPDYLQQLNERGIPSIALTANFTGSIGPVDNLESWKINRLNLLGYDFTAMAPSSEQIVFDDLPSYRGNYSLYTDGALFTNHPDCTKGELLVRFLQLTKVSPKRVIFIDDHLNNLESVEEALACHDPSIQYDGLLYLGADDYPSTLLTEEAFETRWEAIASMARETE